MTKEDVYKRQILGCVWAVWHLPIDFFYYTTPDMGLAALASQFVTCISLGIFMAYTDVYKRQGSKEHLQ